MTTNNKTTVSLAAGKLKAIRGVQDVGLGTKYVKNSPRPGKSLVIYVRQKRRKSALAASTLIKRRIVGLTTDIVEAGPATPLICDPPYPAYPIPAKIRPGAWVGGSAECIWGSVCLFLRDDSNRTYLLTARHAITPRGQDTLGERVFVYPRSNRANPSGITATVVKHTDVEHTFYDAVLAQVGANDRSRLDNTPYGSNVRITSVSQRIPAQSAKANFYGARSAFPYPQSLSVRRTQILSLGEVPELSNDSRWIEFAGALNPGDSGGVMVSQSGERALAILMFGRRTSPGAATFGFVYGTPLRDLIRDLQGSTASVYARGYENLRLRLV